jgi:hypothetical protein
MRHSALGEPLTQIAHYGSGQDFTDRCRDAKKNLAMRKPGASRLAGPEKALGCGLATNRHAAKKTRMR